MHVSKLDREPSNQNACRCQFDDAIEAEREQYEATRRDARHNPNGFDGYKGDCQPFEAECLAHKREPKTKIHDLPNMGRACAVTQSHCSSTYRPACELRCFACGKDL